MVRKIYHNKKWQVLEVSVSSHFLKKKNIDQKQLIIEKQNESIDCCLISFNLSND